MMQSISLKIPVPSRRRAMDWSLVLISQGIGSTIDHEPETDSWALIVAPEDYEKSLAVLQEYRLENRGWHWRKKLPVAGFLFDWGSLAWVFLVLIFYWLESTVDLRSSATMDSSAVALGQWWRLFTAIWLHADLAHLGTNAGLGLVLIGLAMGRYGTGTGLLTAYLAGVGGNLVPCLVSATRHQSLGASGMIMGALGLIAIQSRTVWRQGGSRGRLAFGGLIAGVMLFVLVGVAPGTDILAHFGGFVTGALAGGILVLLPKLSKPKANLLSGFIFVLLVIVPWWAALRTAASKQ